MMTLEAKDLIGILLLLIAFFGGTGVMLVSQRARDAAFFLMITTAVLAHRLDINFLSHYWYRGTTRGFEFTSVEVLAICLLISSLVLPRYGRQRWFWPMSLGPLLLYFVYCAFSVAISEPRIFGTFELAKILRGILVLAAAAMFVRSPREVKILVVALCCTVFFEAALAFKQRYLDGVYRVTGTLEHPNSLSMYLCLIGPVLLAAALSNIPRLLRYACFVGVGLAAIGVLFTISRAGIPVFTVVALGTAVFCCTWRITLPKLITVMAMTLILGAVVFKSWDTLMVRYGESTLEQEYLDETVEGRGLYLRQAGAILDDRFFGVGLNNWSYWVSKQYGAETGWVYEDYDDIHAAPEKETLSSYRYAAPAHNLAALTAGELGWVGLIVFLSIWIRWMQVGATFLFRRSQDLMHQLGIGIFFGTCGVFLQGITEWVYRQTHIMFTLHILLGVLAALYFLKRQAQPTPSRRAAAQAPARSVGVYQ